MVRYQYYRSMATALWLWINNYVLHHKILIATIDTSKSSGQRKETHQPSLSWALTSHPKRTRKVTMSRWPAQMALCRAVMPSSFAAEGSFTWPAVLATNSSSPSNEASRRRASGSKDTRLERVVFSPTVFRFPFFLPVSFSARRRRQSIIDCLQLHKRNTGRYYLKIIVKLSIRESSYQSV